MVCFFLFYFESTGGCLPFLFDLFKIVDWNLCGVLDAIKSMDETEIHEQNVFVEPVSMMSKDPLEGEIELMETEFQIDIKTNENQSDSKNDEEREDILFDTEQTSDRMTSNVEIPARIDTVRIDTGTKVKLRRIQSTAQREEKKYSCEICNKSFQSKILVKRHLIKHFEKSEKPKCTICKEQ